MKNYVEIFKHTRLYKYLMCGGGENKLKNTKIFEILYKLIFFMAILIFAFVNISILVFYGDISYRNCIRFEFNKILLVGSSILMLFVLLMAIKFIRGIELNRNARSFVLAVMTVLHFVILLMIGNELIHVPGENWDEGFCFYNALNLVNDVPLTDYLIRYPAGMGTFIVDYIIILISKLFGLTEIIQYSRMCVFVNVVAIEGTILCSVNVVKKLCNRKEETTVELTAMLISYLFIPYYFYPLLFYSDTYSVLFAALVIKAYTDYCNIDMQNNKVKRIICVLKIVLFTFLGGKIKATIVIILMAIMINEFVRRNFKFCTVSIVTYLTLNMMYSCFLYTINGVVPNRENAEYYKYPYTLYLQFGAEGDYGDYSSDIYTNMISSIDAIGLDETKRNQINEIIDTISSRTLNGHLNFYIGKANRLWGDGLYLLDLEVVMDDGSRNCFLRNSLYQNGIIRTILYYLAQSFQYVMTFGVFFGAVLCFQKRGSKRVLCAMILALTGITCFLVAFWENRSRYLFNMFPLICMIASVVFIEIESKIEKHVKAGAIE